MYSQAGDLVPTHRHQGQAGIEEIEIVRENKNSYYGHRTKAISRKYVQWLQKDRGREKGHLQGHLKMKWNEMKLVYYIYYYIYISFLFFFFFVIVMIMAYG